MTFGTKFLTMPDLFPARNSGERWGTRELQVDFAGGPYCFRGLSTSQFELLSQRFSELRSSAATAEPAVEIQVYAVPPGDFRVLEVPPGGLVYSMDFEFQPRLVKVAARKLMGRLTLEPLSGALWTSVEEPLKDVISVFENFFRLLVAYRLNELGGALLHSAGIVRDSRTFLFLGQSGAGKTTVSRLSQEAGLEVLSDDMNALVMEDGRLVVEKLPFAGDLGQTGHRRGGAPLAGLFRLEKADEHGLSPLPEPEALALLLSCAPFLNADPYRTDLLIEHLARMTRGQMVRKLRFRRDAGFWDLIEGQA